MNRHILTTALILAACSAVARQQLTIVEQDYTRAKQEAEVQHKLLIVDFYTTWCVPCKALDKAIFQNDSMASVIGKDFVVLRYDAEKDSAHNLSLKHHVCSYPTTVVLTADGKLINKMFGLGGTKPLAENYTRLLEESIQLDKQGIYAEGIATKITPEAYPDYYKKYVRRIADLKPGDLDHYWQNNTDLQSEVSLAILAYFGNAPERVTTYFLQHKASYEKKFGKADIAFITERICTDKFSAAIAAKNEDLYTTAVNFAREHLSAADADKYAALFRLDMYVATSKWTNAADLVADRVNKKTMSDNSLNYFCWTVYEQCDDLSIMARAAQWMQSITAAHPSYATLDTYARLLGKLGKKDEAIAVMQQAIAAGKANGEDTKESEEALLKL